MPTAHIRLMIPGPVEVHSAVLEALGKPVEPHYGPAWVEKHAGIIQLLKQVFNTQQDVFLMAGSGSCALDACIGSALNTGEKIIIGNNGFFGDRLVEIAEHNGLEVTQVKEEWGEPLSAESIRQAVKQNPDAKAVAVVHSETSTTILNPIAEIGEVVKGLDAVYIIDAVSSLGGIPFDVDGWGIDLCASATQKCLGSTPGLAPVAVSEKAWSFIDRVERRAHGWYTNLRIWRQYAQEWADWHPTPVTMPVNNANALLVALEQLMEEGIENRMERFRNLAVHLRKGLRRIGMPPFTPDEALNPVLTAAYTPDGKRSEEIVQYLLNAHHIQISGGLGALKSRIFRIGHMSPVLKIEDIETLISALEEFLK